MIRMFLPALLLVFLFASPALAYSPAPVPDRSHGEFHEAAEKCDAAKMSAALAGLSAEEKTTEINRLDREGYTPLGYAAQNGCLEIVKILVEAGAAVDTSEERSRWTPFMRAAQYRRPEVVRYLAAHGADVNVRGPLGQSPWTEVVRGPLFNQGPEGDAVKTLEALMDCGADIRTPEEARQPKVSDTERESERRQMIAEIESLRFEVAELKNTLDNIRSQLGGGETRPTS